MKIVFTNPPPNDPPPIKRIEKTSTTELKQALEKIKQTQLQVLKVLRSEAETSNLTQTEMRQMSENIQANIPYIKSITNVNLLKIAQINKMRKEMEREKERSGERIGTLQQRNKLLEQEIDLKQQAQFQWNNEKRSLIDKINYLTQQNVRMSQNRVPSDGTFGKYQQELNDKMNRIRNLQIEIGNFQQSLRDLSQEKESYRQKYEQTNRQIVILEKKLGETRQLDKSQSKDKLNLPYESLIFEIKKLSSNHEKIYNNLKIRTRVTISDLDTEEEIQQSFSKILKLMENSQKTSLQMEDMGKLPDSYSFAGDQMKKLQKQMYQSEVMRRSIADLKFQNVQLKEDKESLRSYSNELENKLRQYQRQLNVKTQKTNLSELKEYTDIIEELKKEMERIRVEKQELSSLVKTLTETNVKSGPQEGNGLKLLREQLDEIIAINVDLRKENDGLKVMIDGLKLQIQSQRMETRKFDDKISQKQSIVDKEIQEKDYLVQQLKKYTKSLQEKDIIILKLQGRLGQLQKVADGNLQTYQNEVNLKADETKTLRQEIDRLMKELRQLREMAHNYQVVDGQNDRLKKNLMQINTAVIHLWEIKQAEYSNIYTILEKIRK